MSCAPYTGPDGASCHQCKSRRRLTDLFFCCHMPSKTRTCRKKFCKLCLDKFYDNAEPKKGEELVWKCPSCLLKCTCASCQRIMDPNGAKKPRMINNIGHEYDVELATSSMLPSFGRTSLDNTFEHDARQLLLSLTSLPGVRARINQFINLKGVDDQSKIEAIASLLNQGAFPAALGDSESSVGSSTLMPQGSLWLRREKEMAFTFQ